MKDTVIGALALVGLAAIVWFGGEHFKWPEPKIRAAVICSVAALWIVIQALQRLALVRSARRIEEQLRAQASEQVACARPDRKPEVVALEQRFNEALGLLKQSRLGAGALSALPWYVIVGPPGAGKTTALTQSGLNFPVAGPGGKIRGVGGTRNCDWWFADQGILLDTAGRYATELEDRDEWLSFLDLLRRARPHKPINGAIVCISVADLLLADDAKLEEHATRIRERLDELVTRLELVFPVYVLFTKCDSLSGFVEFFEGFSRDQRGQVWGVTLPPDAARDARRAFDEEARKLYRALRSQQVAAIHADRPAEKKRQIYAFPLQFALAQARMADFIGLLFRPNPYGETVAPRGFYFTSGTQEGTPIDRVLAAMGAAFGVGEETGSFAAPAVERKSYFITRLFTDVIFADRHLARSSARAERRGRLVRRATVAASLATTLLVTGALATSFAGNRALARDTKKAMEAAPTIEGLDRLREAVTRLDASPPLRLRFGLYRGAELGDAARTAYWGRMAELFVGPATRRIEDDLNAAIEGRRRDEVLRLLRAYLMLGREARVQAPVVHRALAEKDRWRSGPLADGLMAHFLARLAAADPAVPVARCDDVLKERARELVRQWDWVAERTVELVEESRRGRGDVPVPRGRGADALAYAHPVPDIHTQEYWDSALSLKASGLATALSRELGEVGADRTAEEIQASVRNEVHRLHRLHWRQFVEGVSLREFADIADAERRMEVLCDDGSPLRALFELIRSRQAIRFDDKDARDVPADKPEEWVPAALKVLRPVHGALRTMLGSTRAGARVFAVPEPPALEALVRKLQDAEEAIADAVRPADDAYEGAVRALLLRVVDHCYRAVRAEAMREATRLWQDEVVAKWKADVAGRFPFAAASDEDVPLGAFSALFAPKGAFWTSHERIEAVRQYVVRGVPLVEPSADFAEGVRRASLLRQALYARDAERVTVEFEVTLKDTPGVTNYAIDLGNASFRMLDSGSRRGRLAFVEGKSRGAKLSAWLVHSASERVVHDFSTKPWGLVRLARRGGAKATGADGRSCAASWTVRGDSLGADPEIGAVFTFEARGHLLGEKLFEDFPMPERVGP